MIRAARAARATSSTLGLLLSLACGACARENPVGLVIIAPDGGDPFYGTDAATHVRVTVEDDATAPTTQPVAPGGAFRFELTPGMPAVNARIVVEALNRGEVVGSGASPPIVWQQQGGQVKAILMHRRDGIVEGPVAFQYPRVNAALLHVAPDLIFVLTHPQGVTTGSAIDGYDLSGHARINASQVVVPAAFDQDTVVMPVNGAWLLQRGADAFLYTGAVASSVPLTNVEESRRSLLAASAVFVPGRTGGFLVGGRDAAGVRSRLVHTVPVTEREVTLASFQLATARARPTVITLRMPDSNANIAARWLLVGGHDPEHSDPAALMESFGGDGSVTVSLAASTPFTPRADVAATCITFEQGACTRVLVLGGRVPGAANEDANDLLLDGACVLRNGAGCNVVLAQDRWLTIPRRGAQVALAEGGRVLVVGGRDGTGRPILEVETVDVSNPDRPQRGRVVGTLPVFDSAVSPLPNGSVMIAGGRTMDGTSVGTIWFYRY